MKYPFIISAAKWTYDFIPIYYVIPLSSAHLQMGLVRSPIAVGNGIFSNVITHYNRKDSICQYLKLKYFYYIGDYYE